MIKTWNQRIPARLPENANASVSIALDCMLAEIVELRAELEKIKAQEPAWKENELEAMFGVPHKAYYLAPRCAASARGHAACAD